jgi:oligopeptide/dipeptide ABC transporter ATP-binding protein
MPVRSIISIARQRAIEMMERTGIPHAAERVRQYPHELSGGLRQRVLIAMALLHAPSLLIADEPTSALDVTVQAQILDLLRDLQRETGMAVLFITHDFGVVARLCDRVAVMYAGRIVECGPVAQVFERPAHPYTKALIASVPKMTGAAGRLTTIEGQPPSLLDLPPGCRFAPRCALADDRCRAVYPKSFDVGPEHVADCWRLEAQ